MGVDRHLRDGAAPLLLPSCPRERSVEMAASPFEQGLGALGGAARMGAGMQPAAAGAPPFIHTGVLPPPFRPAPVRMQRGRAEPEDMRTGGRQREAGTPPASRVRTIPFPVMCEREALQRESAPFAQSPPLSPFPPTPGRVRRCAAPAVRPFPHKQSRAAGAAGRH